MICWAMSRWQLRASTVTVQPFSDSSIKGAAQHLTINGDHALAGLGEAGHEALKAGSELIGIKQPEHPTKRVMARRPMLQFEKLAQKALLCPAKDVHIHRSLATT